MRRLSLPLCALLLLPRVVAQDEAGESAQARLLRDQARVGQRLTSLREKLERLAQRYTDEGRDRNAALLRDALTRFDEQKLLDVQRDVQRGLEQGSLSTVERQDALAAGLQAVYAILRDRRDVEELSRQTDLAREGLDYFLRCVANEKEPAAGSAPVHQVEAVPALDLAFPFSAWPRGDAKCDGTVLFARIKELGDFASLEVQKLGALECKPFEPNI